ncbi:23905_t:CDS:10 [Cetraspora pellucida]|uniref:Autophagy-related protein 14 n=1 Tax=Cetraspora pellucida TaxID=1433469 RepID=A0A9N9A606_9GLOM|nr:23905_t:CDS:10 [Cetraspora pellucida]
MSANSTKVFEDNSFLPIVYEANFTVALEIFEEFEAWLQEYLSATLNTKPGFRDAEVFQRDPRNDGGDPEVKNPDRVHKYITVLFEIDNKESIDRYLNEEKENYDSHSATHERKYSMLERSSGFLGKEQHFSNQEEPVNAAMPNGWWSAVNPKSDSVTTNCEIILNNIESCLIDMKKSRDEVITNIDQVLEREKTKLILEKEKSSSELRLSRYRAEIADQNKALEEDRQRINSLRENIRLRRVALEDARSRYQTGNDYLEESHKLLERARVDVLSEALFVTTSKLCARQKELVADLLTIYPIEQVQSESFSFKILGVPLPNSAFTDQVATALGFTCHLIHMLAYYLGVPLRFPMTPMSSKSIIRDPISTSLSTSRQFPLYSKGVDRFRFEYAVFLLNKNIEQLMNSQGLLVMDLRHTLPNLKYLILSLISRKVVPYNYKSANKLRCPIGVKDLKRIESSSWPMFRYRTFFSVTTVPSKETRGKIDDKKFET